MLKLSSWSSVMAVLHHVPDKSVEIFSSLAVIVPKSGKLFSYVCFVWFQRSNAKCLSSVFSLQDFHDRSTWEPFSLLSLQSCLCHSCKRSMIEINGFSHDRDQGELHDESRQKADFHLCLYSFQPNELKWSSAKVTKYLFFWKCLIL
jgi:hypothetical protein